MSKENDLGLTFGNEIQDQCSFGSIRVHEREAWWIVVVDSKYGSSWGGWCSNEPLGTFGVGLSKNIRRGWEKFASHTEFEVGDGSKVRFWHDIWCKDMTLKEAFQELSGIACATDAYVEASLEISGGSNQWNVSFVKVAHD